QTPQAFDGLRQAKRRVRRPELTFATVDHNIPTWDRSIPVKDPLARQQMELLERNCRQSGIRLFGLGNPNQGIVHVIGPEMGMTQPGMTVVCGDSHTSTHGAFGTLAFGIGTSEIEHVLASQCLRHTRAKTFEVRFDGVLPDGMTGKGMNLYFNRTNGTEGGAGFGIEYRGEAVRSLSMEQRMTLCNMSIEGGARAGMIAPDQKTF